jgi:hypothetical protein
MIELTETRQTTPYRWVHPMMMICDEGEKTAFKLSISRRILLCSLHCHWHLARDTIEIRTIFGMHGPECARHAFNGRHLSAFEARQTGESHAATLDAVKPFGPLIDHCTPLFASRIASDGHSR